MERGKGYTKQIKKKFHGFHIGNLHGSMKQGDILDLPFVVGKDVNEISV